MEMGEKQMRKYRNELIIEDAEYKNGLFPKIPDVKKQGSVFILTDGSNNDIVVNEHTTVRDIRSGKYKRIVEISKLKHTKEIIIQSPSRESYFLFEIRVKFVVQVINPLIFCENRNLNIDTHFKNLFASEIRKITQQYTILECVEINEELNQRLTIHNDINNEILGLYYEVLDIDAAPTGDAWDYVEQSGRRVLDSEVKQKTRNLIEKYSKDYEVALMTEVADGKITEAEAIEKIDRYKREKYEESQKVFKDSIETLNSLRENDYLSTQEAREIMLSQLINRGMKIEHSTYEDVESANYEDFYKDENN